MNQTSHARVRQDRRLIGQTLLKLALPRLIVRAIVVAVALIIWYWVANWLLSFGKQMTYESLHSFGPQVVDLLVRINPYLWWVAVGIWTLIAFFALRGWLNASLAAGRATPIQPHVLSDLVAQLSDDVVGVMRWVWGDHEEPFTVGDLRRSMSEIRHNRISKIAMVDEQVSILARTAQTPNRGGRDDSRGDPQNPRYVEPRIGPAR